MCERALRSNVPLAKGDGRRQAAGGRSHTRLQSKRLLILQPGPINPSVQIIIGEALIDEFQALIQRAGAPGETDGIHADLLVVAGVIPLVQLMASAELGSDRVPKQLEQLDALVRRSAGASIIPIDEWTQLRIEEILTA